MGFFGNSTKIADTNKANKNNNNNHHDAQQYEDIESIPVAVAVPSSPKQNGFQKSASNMIVIHPNNNNNNSRIGRQRSVSPMPLAPIILMSRTPILVPQCPICYKTNVRTRTTTYPDFMTWVTCAVLLFIFWPLFWIPLVLDSTRRTIHYCSACHSEIGSIRPFKDCCVKHR